MKAATIVAGQQIHIRQNTFLEKVRNDSSFSDVRQIVGSSERLDNQHIESRERQQHTF
jgi:hypothetical protein